MDKNIVDDLIKLYNNKKYFKEKENECDKQIEEILVKNITVDDYFIVNGNAYIKILHVGDNYFEALAVINGENYSSKAIRKTRYYMYDLIYSFQNFKIIDAKEFNEQRKEVIMSLMNENG